jgi:hypothetical protein
MVQCHCPEQISQITYALTHCITTAALFYLKTIGYHFGSASFSYEPFGTMHHIYRTNALLLSRERFLYILSTNIFNDYFILATQSPFIPPQSVVYFIMLTFLLVHKIFTFYINGVLKFKCPTPGPKG